MPLDSVFRIFKNNIMSNATAYSGEKRPELSKMLYCIFEPYLGVEACHGADSGSTGAPLRMTSQVAASLSPLSTM